MESLVQLRTNRFAGLRYTSLVGLLVPGYSFLLFIDGYLFAYLFAVNRFWLLISTHSFLVTRSWNLLSLVFVTIPVATKMIKGCLLFCGNVELSLP